MPLIEVIKPFIRIDFLSSFMLQANGWNSPSYRETQDSCEWTSTQPVCLTLSYPSVYLLWKYLILQLYLLIPILEVGLPLRCQATLRVPESKSPVPGRVFSIFHLGLITLSVGP